MTNEEPTEEQPEERDQEEHVPAWKNKSKKGGEYISFTINGQRYAMFENTKKKEGRNQPDYRILRSPKSPPDEEPPPDS
jgi:uncharacterized protein (DUF736 family)